MKMSLKLLLFAVFAVGTVSSNSYAEDYFPLKTGIEKTFSYEEHRGVEGNVIGELRDYFEGEVELGNNKYMKVVRTFKNVPQRDSTVFYFRKTQSALYSVSVNNNKVSKETTEWPLPLTLHSSWTVTYPTGSTVEKKFESIEDVYIADTKYSKCARISFKTTDKYGREYNNYMIFAQKLGMIKQYTNAVDGSYTLKVEILKHNIK